MRTGPVWEPLQNVDSSPLRQLQAYRDAPRVNALEHLSATEILNLVIHVYRDGEWGGNRFEIDIGGLPIWLQRRGVGGRKDRKRTTKGSRTLIGRGKSDWLLMIDDFNFTELKNSSGQIIPSTSIFTEVCLRHVETNTQIFGDAQRFCLDAVIIKMFNSGWDS